MTCEITSVRLLAGTAIFLLVGMFAGTPSARAWGCKGHQAVALIAERHLTPEARQFVEKLLEENPVDPQVKRYCGSSIHDLLADASTWPDDVRNERKNGAWHYIEIPRGAPRHPLEEYCGTQGCVTRAIAEQWAVLKDAHAEPRKRAEALRYIVHFVGDLHMPLHAATNNDLGGNCVPVHYLRRRPHQSHDSFSPNLHAIWDTAILERDMEGADPAEFADYLEQSFGSELEQWQKAGIHIEDWTWESHDLAESVAYGELRPKDPVEAPVSVHSCADDNHVGERLFQMQLTADQAYQDAAAVVVEKRLAQAGVRLAMILNDAAKPSPAGN
ncbi:MAG TPA: S1/P1 nuclease [Verrucomicrobiae bacterium]|nr:S1/P1 nuclease [Verrucomicrobiae bacterium]